MFQVFSKKDALFEVVFHHLVPWLLIAVTPSNLMNSNNNNYHYLIKYQVICSSCYTLHMHIVQHFNYSIFSIDLNCRSSCLFSNVLHIYYTELLNEPVVYCLAEHSTMRMSKHKACVYVSIVCQKYNRHSKRNMTLIITMTTTRLPYLYIHTISILYFNMTHSNQCRESNA